MHVEKAVYARGAGGGVAWVEERVNAQGDRRESSSSCPQRSLGFKARRRVRTANPLSLILSQLDDPYGVPEARELADATANALRILRSVRAAHGIDTSSPVNICISTGRAVVATRFSFDYGWYPSEDEMLETDLPFVSLWYAIGGEYTKRDGDWQMTAGDPPRSVIVASEPLTTDFSTWLEVPEYSMLTAELTPEGLEFETRDLDV